MVLDWGNQPEVAAAIVAMRVDWQHLFRVAKQRYREVPDRSMAVRHVLAMLRHYKARLDKARLAQPGPLGSTVHQQLRLLLWGRKETDPSRCAAIVTHATFKNLYPTLTISWVRRYADVYARGEAEPRRRGRPRKLPPRPPGRLRRPSETLAYVLAHEEMRYLMLMPKLMSRPEIEFAFHIREQVQACLADGLQQGDSLADLVMRVGRIHELLQSPDLQPALMGSIEDCLAAPRKWRVVASRIAEKLLFGFYNRQPGFRPGPGLLRRLELAFKRHETQVQTRRRDALALRLPETVRVRVLVNLKRHRPGFEREITAADFIASVRATVPSAGIAGIAQSFRPLYEVLSPKRAAERIRKCYEIIAAVAKHPIGISLSALMLELSLSASGSPRVLYSELTTTMIKLGWLQEAGSGPSHRLRLPGAIQNGNGYELNQGTFYHYQMEIMT